MKKNILLFIIILCAFTATADNGYNLWLNYKPVDNKTLLQLYRNNITALNIQGSSGTLDVTKQELTTALTKLLAKNVNHTSTLNNNGTLLAGNGKSLKAFNITGINDLLQQTGDEGYIIVSRNINGKKIIVITGNTDKAVLYGSFHFIRLLQTQQTINNLNITSIPQLQHRILNHWDNLTRYVERGYAGISIFNWHTLPDYIDTRYIDYARANASIGINGTVLTNVNANATVLTAAYLQKVKALAAVFRPYGIKVYLTARFSAPLEIGVLKTSDPLDASVQKWWQEKAKEIYSIIPDFGGFLVKANSEGQPGPQDYKRNHADGANMLADAVAPYGGIIMWRAFVYSHEVNEDRFKQAYNEFKPLDGQFRNNVMVQVKNGPIDFQPREPFHPLFGAMTKTPLMMEFQLTQEYLGQATHLVYEAPMFKEILASDTYAKGKGSTVQKVINGSLNNHSFNGMAGVANIGNDVNWTGHPFGQANWYMFGRLAWNMDLSAEEIAADWVKQTFLNKQKVVQTILQIMINSYEAMVNYMTPLGLHHIMGNGHHYGPLPWGNTLPRADWNPVYFHAGNDKGIGFDRTKSGSNALAQFNEEVRNQWKDVNTIDERFILWFHHVPWSFKMKSGRTLWEEICFKYNEGVSSIKAIQQQWNSLETDLDKERFNQVKQLLAIQVNEAIWWRDACLSYFQTLSKQPIPLQYEQPKHSLEYYKSLSFPYAPGDGK